MSNTLDITADAMITAAATALNAAVEKVCAFSHYPLSHIVWSQIASLRYYAVEGVAHAQIISEIIKDKLAEAAVAQGIACRTAAAQGIAQGIACRTAAADSIKDCLKKTLDCLKKFDFWDNWHILKDSLTPRIKDCPESLTHFINVACATLTDAGLVLAAPTPGDFEELLPALPSRTASRIASRTPEQLTHPVLPLAPIALEGAGASLVDAPVTESLEGAKRNAKRNLLTNFEAAQAQGQGTDLEEDDFEIVVHIMPPYVPPAVQEEVAAAPAPVEAPKKKRKAHSQGKVEPRPKRQRQCKFPKNLDDYC